MTIIGIIRGVRCEKSVVIIVSVLDRGRSGTAARGLRVLGPQHGGVWLPRNSEKTNPLNREASGKLAPQLTNRRAAVNGWPTGCQQVSNWVAGVSSNNSSRAIQLDAVYSSHATGPHRVPKPSMGDPLF